MQNHIRSSLLKIMNEYLTAKTEGFSNHPLANFVRRDIPKLFKNLSFIDSDQYEISASVGQGNWAYVPWIAIMNKEVTTSTQRGYYAGYLFSEDMTQVYLTIAQGVTETSKEEMLEINEEIRNSVKKDSKVEKDDNIYLGESIRAKEYALSTAIYIPYNIDDFTSEEELQTDLQELLNIYEKYIIERNSSGNDHRFIDKIVEALGNLGGQATLAEIYNIIWDKHSNELQDYKHWKAKVRQQIYFHSSETDIFQGQKGDENDLFYSIEGKGKGVWGLRDYSTNLINSNIEEEEGEYTVSDTDLINHIHKYIENKGFHYSLDEVTNLFLSLKTKPFVILSGISGTGKTKIAQLFAESIGATEKNGQFMLIPVRPDWSDGSDLLGYVDIKGEFKEGPLTKIIRHALKNPNKPHIVLLDEMNLARVEYYFSDILSVMESRRWENGKIVSSNLLTDEIAGFNMQLPKNLYKIGTVNMDETTHPFSKKVLDRANTIEFNEIDLRNLAFLQEDETVDALQVTQGRLASEYLHMKDAYFKHKDIIDPAIDELVRINQILQLMYAHVGYRVRDEICFYLVYNDKANLLSFKKAFDYCILQKILPRISGSDSRVNHILRDLYKNFTNIEYDENSADYEAEIANASYPKSAAKVLEMLRRLEDGFTSFWIS